MLAWITGGGLCYIVATAVGQPSFTSLHVFGDSVSSTTDSPGAPDYYGHRYSNGRTWVEVLADWYGVSFDITNDNRSFWEHYSSVLTNTLNAYTFPSDATSALFVVWVNNADMYWNITQPPFVYDDSQLSKWTNANNQWISNHFTVLTNLYANGVRSVLMPNAADLTKTPNFPGLTSAERAWIHQRTVEFNRGFQNMLNNAMAAFPELAVYSPDIFALLEAVIADPAAYGMTHPGIGALDDPALGDYSLDGPGADYVFWDFIHPTAKLQRLFAEAARELIWPMEIQSIASTSGTSRLNAVNIPMGRSSEEIGVEDEEWGRVLGSTNLVDWVGRQSFNRTNTTQTILVPTAGWTEFYRLEIASDWIWP